MAFLPLNIFFFQPQLVIFYCLNSALPLLLHSAGMGPEGLFASRNPFHIFEKTPSSFDGYGNHQQYRANVALWDVMTSVELQRKAPTFIGRLSRQTQIVARAVNVATLAAAEILTKLLQKLHKKFGLDKISLLHTIVSEFLDFTWDRAAIVDGLVIWLHSRLEKILNLTLDEKLKDRILLRQANLDLHDRNFILGSAGANYVFQSIFIAHRNAFRAMWSFTVFHVDSLSNRAPPQYRPVRKPPQQFCADWSSSWEADRRRRASAFLQLHK